MTDYDPAADGLNSYLLACRLQREKLLRDGKWKSIGPRDDDEKRIATKGNDGCTETEWTR